ncbi:hypothetical protein Tco_1102737 [Tanacetum coccineum]
MWPQLPPYRGLHLLLDLEEMRWGTLDEDPADYPVDGGDNDDNESSDDEDDDDHATVGCGIIYAMVANSARQQREVGRYTTMELEQQIHQEHKMFELNYWAKATESLLWTLFQLCNGASMTTMGHVPVDVRDFGKKGWPHDADWREILLMLGINEITLLWSVDVEGQLQDVECPIVKF